MLKDEIYGLITSGKKTTVILSELKAKELDTELYGVLTEILTAYEAVTGHTRCDR